MVRLTVHSFIVCVIFFVGMHIKTQNFEAYLHDYTHTHTHTQTHEHTLHTIQTHVYTITMTAF